MNELLLLDATTAVAFEEHLLDLKKLELYYVNRDTLKIIIQKLYLICIVLFKVCKEGGIAKDVILVNTKRGLKPSGDLIPWIIGEHYQDKEFLNRKWDMQVERWSC